MCLGCLAQFIAGRMGWGRAGLGCRGVGMLGRNMFYCCWGPNNDFVALQRKDTLSRFDLSHRLAACISKTTKLIFQYPSCFDNSPVQDVCPPGFLHMVAAVPGLCPCVTLPQNLRVDGCEPEFNLETSICRAAIFQFVDGDEPEALIPTWATRVSAILEK